MKNERNIGGIGNYYGGLCVATDDDGKFYWSIENYDGNDWQEIPESLYNELVKYDDTFK